MADPRVVRVLMSNVALPDLELPDVFGAGRRPSWQRDALCRERPGLEFVPSQQSPPRLERLRQVCRACPVRVECVAGARRDDVGVWGGLTAAQRARWRAEGLSLAEMIARVDVESPPERIVTCETCGDARYSVDDAGRCTDCARTARRRSRAQRSADPGQPATATAAAPPEWVDVLADRSAPLPLAPVDGGPPVDLDQALADLEAALNRTRRPAA